MKKKYLITLEIYLYLSNFIITFKILLSAFIFLCARFDNILSIIEKRGKKL